MKKICALIVMLFMSIASTAHAASARMLFWYPGEAGSTAEAQPVLDEFFAYIAGKDNNIKLTGAYDNTLEGGTSYLKGKKPAVGVVSYPVYEMHKGLFSGAQVFLATLPRPHGTKTEKYALVGTKPLADDGQTVYMSEPLTRDFITSQLFPGLPAGVKLQQTESIVHKLKKISQGEMTGYAILTPSEAYTLSKMNSDWATKITTLQTSSPVPTARVLLFNPGFKDADALTNILLGMQADPAAKAIMDELRLVGFSIP